MSYAFDARFSPTSLDLPEILARLEPCLHDARIHYDGEVAQLHSRGGQPTVLSLTTTKADTLGGVVAVARRWWGVSLFAVSGPLADELGKSDAIEVYLRLFEQAGVGRMLVYNENSGAFRARCSSNELNRDLTALLAGIAGALAIELAIYAEEADETTAPDLAELERRLALQAASRTTLAWAAVVATRSMSLARARELAGPWAGRVAWSTKDYVVLSFLDGALVA